MPAPRTHAHAPLACTRAERSASVVLSAWSLAGSSTAGDVWHSRVHRSCTGTPQCSPSLALLWAHTRACPRMLCQAHASVPTRPDTRPWLMGRLDDCKRPREQADRAHHNKGCGLKSAQGWECSLASISQTTTHMHGHHETTIWLAGVTLVGSRAQSSSSEPHRTRPACHRRRTRSLSRVQTAPSLRKWSAASRPSTLE